MFVHPAGVVTVYDELNIAMSRLPAVDPTGRAALQVVADAYLIS